jgi:hypothetical protein
MTVLDAGLWAVNAQTPGKVQKAAKSGVFRRGSARSRRKSFAVEGTRILPPR